MRNHDQSSESHEQLTAAPVPADESTEMTGRCALDARRRSATCEITNAVDELRQLMARADALAAVTDEQFSRVVVLRDGDDRRDFRRLAYLVELTASAVLDASDASDRLIAAVEHTLPSEGR